MKGFAITCNECNKTIVVTPVKEEDGLRIYEDLHEEENKQFDGISIWERSGYQLIIQCDCESEGE